MDPSRLYVETPDGEVLQMCFMRPTAEQLCPKLPFLLRVPEVSASACGLVPMPMPAELVLQQLDTEEISPAVHLAKGSSKLSPELLHRLCDALIRGEEIPDVSNIPLSEWHRALGPQSTDPLAILLRDPRRMLRVAVDSRSEALSDLLLDQFFPRLLEEQCECVLQQALVNARHLPSTSKKWPTSAPNAAQPLPPLLSELLVLLLHSSSKLRLGPSEFNHEVLSKLDAKVPLGPRASAEAVLIYGTASLQIH